MDLFDSVLWSTTNVGRMADTAASYFSNVEGNTTLFTLEHAASAVEQFAQLVEGAVPQEALTWTEDQAVEAFINGEAITLIAGQDRMEEIAAAMDEGAWDVARVSPGHGGPCRHQPGVHGLWGGGILPAGGQCRPLFDLPLRGRTTTPTWPRSAARCPSTPPPPTWSPPWRRRAWR